MAGELVTGYIRLIPTVEGIQGATAAAMAPASGIADAEGKKSGKRFGGGFAASLKGVAAGIGAAFVVAKVSQFIGDSIDEASNLNETMSKSKVIFGENAAEIAKWGGTAAKNLGLSKNQAIASAASFGDMFSQIGFSNTAAVKMSKGVVQLSADLGSFNNLETADVSARMSAAFRGEYDSLQALIPNINAARVEQEALATTGKKSAKELTAQEKAAATLAIVQRDGARATGDFARTAGGLANQKKILSAQTADLKAKMGNALLPVMASLTALVNTKLMPAITALIGFLQKNPQVVIAFGAAVGALAVAFIAAQVAAFAIPLAIAAAIGALVYAYTKFETFRAIVNAVFGFIATYIKVQITVAMAVLRGTWAVIKAVIGFFRSLYTGVRDNVGDAVAAVKAVPGKIKDFFTGAGDWLKSAGEDVMNGLIAGIDKGLEWVKDKLGGVGKFIPGWLKKVLGISSPSRVMANEVGRWILPGVGDGVDGTITALRSRISAAMSAATTGLSGNSLAVAGGGTTPASSIGTGVGGSQTVNQKIYPQPRQSEKEIGDAAADRALWALRK